MRKSTLFFSMAMTLLNAQVIVLDSVVVSATRTDATLDETQGNVSLLKQEDLQMLPNSYLQEALRTQEGVNSTLNRGEADTKPAVTLRGIPNQARTLILLDGVPMNLSYSGEVSLAFLLASQEIEQIEILRGPFSSLYGSNAIGGVINFTTHMPKKAEYHASIGYGDAFTEGEAPEGLVKGYFSAADALTPELRLKAHYSFTTTKGYRSDYVTTASTATGYSGFIEQSSLTDSAKSQYIVGNAGKRELYKYDMGLRAEYEPRSEDIFTFSYRQSHAHTQYNDAESFLKEDATGDTVYSISTIKLKEYKFLQGQTDTLSHLLALGYTHKFDDSSLKIDASSLFIDEWYTAADSTALRSGGTGVITPSFAQNKLISATWKKPFEESLLLLGTEFKRTDTASQTYTMFNWLDSDSQNTLTTDAGGKEEILAAFGEFRYDLDENLFTTAGGRFESWKGYDGYSQNIANPALDADYDTSYQNNFSPKISINYLPTQEVTLKASWGEGFRTPDIRSLYRTYEIPLLKRVYQANPNLEPEHSTSYDFGVEYITPLNGLLKAYVFHTQLRDMISSKAADVVDGTTTYERINVAKASSDGYELSLVQPLPNDFMLQMNYTKTYTEILENDADLSSVGKEFEGIPEDNLYLGVKYKNKSFYSLLSYSYESKAYNTADNSDTVSDVYGSLDETGVFDAKVGYYFTKRVDLSLAITNLFDKEYYSYEKAQGAAWFTQLTIKL